MSTGSRTDYPLGSQDHLSTGRRTTFILANHQPEWQMAHLEEAHNISARGSDYIIDDPHPSELQEMIFDFDDPPLVTFVIPAYNDADILERCLNSICSQSYPALELLVVDNGSSDGSQEIAERYADRVLQVDGLLGKVRQRGFEAASGDIIGSFDSDNILPHDKWLRNAVCYFNYGDDVANVWAKNVAPPNAGPMSQVYWDLWETIVENRIQNERGIFGGSCLLRKDAVDAVGGMATDEHWGEDFNLGKNLKDAGYSVVYIRDPIYHDTDMGKSLYQFTRKQFLGAKAFVGQGFEPMDMPLQDVLYEQFVLGTARMTKELLIEREPHWLYFPVFQAIRSAVYGYSMVNNRTKKLLESDE